MKHLIVLTVAVFCMTGCNAQNTKKNKDTENQLAQKEEPKGSWEVKKEVDENGNIIRYDSIYTYSSKDKLGTNVIKKYRSIISEHFPEFKDDLLADKNDNEVDDVEQYFEKLFENNMINDEMLQQFPEMKQMLKQMEAIQQQMMQHYRHRTPFSTIPKSDSNSTDYKKEDSL